MIGKKTLLPMFLSSPKTRNARTPIEKLVIYSLISGWEQDPFTIRMELSLPKTVVARIAVGERWYLVFQ